MIKTSKVVLIIALAVGLFLLGYFSGNYVIKDSSDIEIENLPVNINKELASKTDNLVNTKQVKSVNENYIISTNQKEEAKLVDCLECPEGIKSEGESQDKQIEHRNSPVSSKDIELDLESLETLTLEEEHQVLDELLINEPINDEWAAQTESNINKIFQDGNNYQVLSESNLDYLDSECRSTVCGVSFVPTQELDRMGRFRQLLSLTSFFEQNEDLHNAQMFTTYTDDGRLVVKLKFKK